MRVLGLDLGEKRIGVSISDEGRKIARGLKRIIVRNKEEAVREIKEICQKERVFKIVVGLPLTLEGKEKKQAEVVRKLSQKIKKETGLPLIFLDERFSSKEAERILKEEGARGAKEKIDIVSAILILESYLKSQR